MNTRLQMRADMRSRKSTFIPSLPSRRSHPTMIWQRDAAAWQVGLDTAAAAPPVEALKRSTQPH